MGRVMVYGPPFSTAVSRVLTCLVEKEVEFQVVPVNLSKAQHKSSDFLKLQPFGQVPVLQDDSVTLFESRAICRYICDKYASKGNTSLMGSGEGGLVQRAFIDQWLEAESQSINPPSTTLVAQLIFYPKMKLKQEAAAIRDADRKLKKVFDVYDQRLGVSRFLAGEEFSLADLSHLPNSHYLISATDRGQLFTSNKNMRRWWAEISGRPSWQKVLEMHKSPPAT